MLVTVNIGLFAHSARLAYSLISVVLSLTFRLNWNSLHPLSPMLTNAYYNLGAGPRGLKCTRSVGAIERQGMIVDPAQCEKKARERRELCFLSLPWS